MNVSSRTGIHALPISRCFDVKLQILYKYLPLWISVTAGLTFMVSGRHFVEFSRLPFITMQSTKLHGYIRSF